MEQEKIKEALFPLFEKNLIEDILHCAEIIEANEGSVIMDYGKKVRFMPIIISGTLRVMHKNDEGREMILYYLSRNESCAMAYACCMEAKLSEVKAIAEDRVALLKIPHEKLDEWLMKYPSWKSYVFKSFTQRFNELLRSLDAVAFQKLDERLIKYLKDKTKVSGKSSIQLSHQQIAEEMGTNRVVISRLLKQLENDHKLVLYRNEIKLLSTFN